MDGRNAELLQWIERDREVLLDFFRRFIRCRTRTREAAGHVRQFLAQRGADCRVIAPNEIMPNLVATVRGRETRPSPRAERQYRRLSGERRRRLDARPVG
jgi:hypothetical protein